MLALVVGSGLGCVRRVDHDFFVVDEEITAIVLDWDAGDIEVVGEPNRSIVDVTLTLRCGSPGDIALRVPAGAYDLVLDTGVGEIDQYGLANDPHAEATILARTGAGDITVSGR